MKYKLLGILTCFLTCFLAINYWSQVSFDLFKKQNNNLLQKVAIHHAIALENTVKNITQSHNSLKYYIEKKQQIPSQQLKYIIEQSPALTSIAIAPNSLIEQSYPNNATELKQLISAKHLIRGRPQTFYTIDEPNENGLVIYKHQPIEVNNKLWGFIRYGVNLNALANQALINTHQDKAYSFQLVLNIQQLKERVVFNTAKAEYSVFFQALLNFPQLDLRLKVFPIEQQLPNTLTHILFSMSLASIITLIGYLGFTEPNRLRRKAAKARAEQQYLKHILQTIIDNVDHEVLYTDLNGQVIFSNRPAQNSQHTPSNIKLNPSAEDDQSLVYINNSSTLLTPSEHPLNRTLFYNQLINQQINIVDQDKQVSNMEITSFPVNDNNEDNQHIGALCITKKICTPPQSVMKELSRTTIIEMIEQKHSLDDVFEYIISNAENSINNIIISISLTDNSQDAIGQVFSNTLPKFFTQSMLGTKINPRLMSGNAAIAQNKLIIVEDINVHPYWTSNKQIATQAGINACWSQPLHSSEGDTVGSLDFYSNSHLLTSPEMIVSLKETAILVSLSLTRYKEILRLNQMTQAIEHSVSAVCITSADGVIEYVNPLFLQLSGFERHELVGSGFELLLSKNHQNQSLKNITQAWQGQVVLQAKNQLPYWANTAITPIHNNLQRISQYIISQNKLSFIAPYGGELENSKHSIDPLSGLLNYATLIEHLNTLILQAKQGRSSHLVASVKIRQYSKIMNLFGEHACDELISQIAQQLNHSLNQGNVIAHANGDQFIILLEHCHQERATTQLHSLIELINKFEFHWQKSTELISISIGTSQITNNQTTAAEYLKQADHGAHFALLAHKPLAHFSEISQPFAFNSGDIYWANKMSQALLIEQYETNYVPIFALDNPAMVVINDIELVMPIDGGSVLPNTLAGALSREKLSTRLDKYLIKQTINSLLKTASTDTTKVSIRLSRSSLLDDALAPYLLSLLKRDHIDASQLVLSISEYNYQHHHRDCTKLINALKATGCQFMLDDFGLGHSSFSLLRQSQVNFIKIKTSLVENALFEASSQEIITIINRLAQHEGIRMVTSTALHKNHQPVTETDLLTEIS